MALAGTHNRTHQTAVFLCDERPHIAGSLVEVGHRHLLPYTYNFQDNGGALGEVTVTNTGAPTESWAGCYMSDCANNHAESSRVCGAGGRWAAGVSGGGKAQSERGGREKEREEEREGVYKCVRIRRGGAGGAAGLCREVANRSWQIIFYFLIIHLPLPPLRWVAAKWLSLWTVLWYVLL